MTTMTAPRPAASAATVASPPAFDPTPDAPLHLAGLRVHFVGVGGCGMSGLARIAQANGARCTGSDLAASPATAALAAQGIAVTHEQSAAALPADAQALVISAAVKPDHPEVAEARRRGLPVLKYAQMLGRLMIGRTAVAVAGTHGKSSTTSMLSHVLIQAGLDPSFIVGATCRQIGGGARVSSVNGPILVAEACEFDRSFHNFHPTHSLILNVEVDHLDVYAGIEEIVESFAVFARKLPADGSLLIHHESPHRLAITADLPCRVETIGFAPQSDWKVHCNGDRLVRLYHDNTQVAAWHSPMPGEHMAYNAAAAAVTAHRLGASWDAITAALAGFQGLDRRMQRIGERQGVTVIDDYGHHPTEVDTTLRALRRHYNPQRLVCVFQPHQHSRTRFLLNEFAASFSAADLVVVPDIYFSRDSEAERRAVTASDLVDRLRHRRVAAMHLYPFAAIVEQLHMITRPGDLIVTMGAGDVWKIARDYVAA